MPPTLQPQSQKFTHPLAVYEQAVRDGKLKDDEGQRLVSTHLQELHTVLSTEGVRASFFSKILSSKKTGHCAQHLYLGGGWPRQITAYGYVLRHAESAS